MDISDSHQTKIRSGNVFHSAVLNLETRLSYPRHAAEDQPQDLRHVVGPIPTEVWLIAFAGAAQRFAFWSTMVSWENYLTYSPDSVVHNGAPGLRPSLANTINNAYFLCENVTPMLSAVVSDTWLGRFKTFLISLMYGYTTHGLVYFDAYLNRLVTTGCTILFVTSLPPIQVYHTVRIVGTVVASVFMNIGQGAAHAVLHPLLGDQLPDHKAQTFRVENEKIVLIDRGLTIQHIFNVYHWMVNVAAFLSIITFVMEEHIGFWASYLLPACTMAVTTIPLIIWNRKFVKYPSQGNVLSHAAKVCFLAVKAGFRLSAASPAHQSRHHGHSVPWSSNFVNEIQRAVRALRIIFCFVVFWLCYYRLVSSVISQADQMRTGNISDNALKALNPVACIILGPLMQKGLFPWLSRHRINFSPISRIATAFILTALGLGYITFIQHLIYSQGPCYSHPLACPAALVSMSRDSLTSVNTKRLPNNISVWTQAPLHFVLGIAEILGVVSLSEHIYAQAPGSMKAFLNSFQWLVVVPSTVIDSMLEPVSKDPWLVIIYGSLAGVMGCTSLLFWMLFRRSEERHLSKQPERIEMIH